ncbi:hypothetical protein RB195_017933 [Necator americanus]|uniref:Uncharacterized protein n=1 Tax=Necator americanus TaxID=51031 RepID=A0ABR1C7E9_NECAM
MLIVSSTKKVPFSDFNGFVKALEEGSYRFLTPSHDWIPECPGAYTAVSCVELFDRIFKKYPPVKGGISQLANESFVRKQKSPLVSVQWYEESRIGGKYSVWTQKTFRSNIWVIADFIVSPASFILATNFSYLNELNKGIIELLPAFKESCRPPKRQKTSMAMCTYKTRTLALETATKDLIIELMELVSSSTPP